MAENKGHIHHGAAGANALERERVKNSNITCCTFGVAVRVTRNFLVIKKQRSIPPRFRFSRHPGKPVSYTHLDVYKRQDRNCL